MRKYLPVFILFLLTVLCVHGQTQTVQNFPQLKSFQQNLNTINVQFAFPKDFKEIKTVRNADLDFDYAMELPNENFQVWYSAKTQQQQRARLKVFEDDAKFVNSHPDSLYKTISTAAAIALAGKNNYTSKTLPTEMLNLFHADEGKSYLLNLYNSPATNHYKYGLLICLQKNGTGCVSMLFFSNDNGTDFYKNVNKACYAVRFN